MKKKILITGGAGYIGSHVVTNLLKSNYEIFVLDKLLFNENSLKSFDKNKNLHMISNDIRDYSNTVNTENVDMVIHLAALVVK